MVSSHHDAVDEEKKDGMDAPEAVMHSGENSDREEKRRRELLPPDPDEGLDEEERRALDRKVLWKLDLRLVPWLSFLYLISFLDRTNIGNAKVENLPEDLGLTNGQFNASLSVFFVTYSLFEPLTNVIVKRFRPSLVLPTTMLIWGIVMTTMGLVHNYGGLVTARLFLGLAEAALFPGINFILSCWYRRSEFGLRAAIFFSAAALAGSFGGLLAAAIANMDGVGGKAGWSWIFILEGLATVLVSIASYWLVYDFPADKRSFLTEAEKARVIRRLAVDKQASATAESFSMKFVWQGLRDYKTYLFAIVYMGADCPLYAFSLFLPTVIAEMGFGPGTTANLLSVPPYALGAIVTVAIGFIADRTKQRGLCNICASMFGIIGFSMLLGSSKPGVQYAGTFLGAAGIYPCIANTISWAANNVEGVYKRGFVMGVVIGVGNLSGVISSNIYQATSSPRFRPGHGVVLGFLTVFLFGGSIVTHIVLKNENKKRLAGRRDNWAKGKSDDEIAILGDKRPDFIYSV